MSGHAISQNTDTKLGETRYDPETQTQVLDSLQIVNVDKGLRNEERQRKRILELEQALKDKDETIKQLNDEKNALTERLMRKLDQIEDEGKKATEATEQLLENEKNKRKYGLYVFGEYNMDPLNNFGGGVTLTTKGLMFGAKAGAISIDGKNEAYFGAILGFKLF